MLDYLLMGLSTPFLYKRGIRGKSHFIFQQATGSLDLRSGSARQLCSHGGTCLFLDHKPPPYSGEYRFHIDSKSVHLYTFPFVKPEISRLLLLKQESILLKVIS